MHGAPLSVILATVFASATATAQPDELVSSDEKTRLAAVQQLARGKSVDPTLTAALVERLREDSAPAVRQQAALALGKVQPVQKLALAALVEVVTDSEESPGVRVGAAEALGRLGKGSRRVATALEKAAADPAVTLYAVGALLDVGAEDQARSFVAHADANVRLAAVMAYGRRGHPDALALALASSDLALRRESIGMLQTRDYARVPLRPAETTALVKATEDADAAVRVQAIQALTRGGAAAQVIPLLLTGLKATDENVRWASAEGLAAAGPEVAKHLKELLAVVDSITPERAKLGLIRALGEAGAESRPALPKLYAFLKSTDVVTRRYAVEALLKAGVADPVETLRQVKPYANDTDVDTATAVAKVVAALGNTPADLGALLRNPNQAEAVRALPTVIRLGPDALPLVPDLLGMANHFPVPKPGFAVATPIGQVADALVAIGPKATPRIAEAMKSKEVRVRQLAALALDRMRLDAVDALPALRQGLNDPDPSVRMASGRGLANLGYRAKPAIPDLIKSLTTHEDSSSGMGHALAWIGTTGSDAKSLMEMVKSPTPRATWIGRLYAAAGTGKDALAVLQGIVQSLDMKDPVRGAAQDACTFTDREELLKMKLNALKDTANRDPHETAFEVLRFELNDAQKKQLIEGLVFIIENWPAPIQVAALRCLAWVGPEAASAVPAVEKLLASKDDTLRRRAEITLKQLRP